MSAGSSGRRSGVRRRGGLARRVAGAGLRMGVVAAALYGAAGFVTSRTAPAPTLLPDLPASGGVLAAAATPGAGPTVRTVSCPDPRCATLASLGGTEVLGVSSVHTGRSGDAEGTFDEVATSARRAGLDFVLIGDHPGPWLDAPDALEPLHREGVLLVPGQELVVDGVGRTLAIGLDTLVDRWRGSVPALARRIDAAGGFVAVVHPRSPRGRERWTGIDAPGLHAWEALDVSEVARIRLADRWAAYHLTSFLGGLVAGWADESVLRLNREGVAAPGLLAYDSARAAAPLTLLAALNHHPKARIAGRLVPGYTPFFRTHVNHVLLAPLPSGDAHAARARLLDGLRRGRTFVSLGGAAEARGFRLAGRSAGEEAGMGEALAWTPGSELLVRLPAAGPEQMLVRVLADGVEVGWAAGSAGSVLAVTVDRPGIWRVEVHRAGRALGPVRFDLRPWILSNPVEFGGEGGARLARR